MAEMAMASAAKLRMRGREAFRPRSSPILPHTVPVAWGVEGEREMDRRWAEESYYSMSIIFILYSSRQVCLMLLLFVCCCCCCCDPLLWSFREEIWKSEFLVIHLHVSSLVVLGHQVSQCGILSSWLQDMRERYGDRGEDGISSGRQHACPHQRSVRISIGGMLSLLFPLCASDHSHRVSFLFLPSCDRCHSARYPNPCSATPTRRISCPCPSFLPPLGQQIDVSNMIFMCKPLVLSFPLNP